ncbi:MAG TPA: hypothetical protein VGM26_00105 [Rhizomicrobium sp.]|jgi:hypothetical protein
MFGFKAVVGALTLTTMISSSAIAASTGALAPGKPAGVKNAQISTGTLLIAGGAAAVALAVAIVVSDQSGDRTGQKTSFAPATTAP